MEGGKTPDWKSGTENDGKTRPPSFGRKYHGKPSFFNGELGIGNWKAIGNCRLPIPDENKKVPSQIWDKTFILRYHPSWRGAPPRLAYSHTRRPGNGCGPRRSLLSLAPFAPPSQVHSPECSLPRFHPPRLSGRQRQPVTPLARRFSLIAWYYTQRENKCQPSNCIKSKVCAPCFLKAGAFIPAA